MGCEADLKTGRLQDFDAGLKIRFIKRACRRDDTDTVPSPEPGWFYDGYAFDRYPLIPPDPPLKKGGSFKAPLLLKGANGDLPLYKGGLRGIFFAMRLFKYRLLRSLHNK